MDLPKFHPNERVDLGDVEFMSLGPAGEFQRFFTNLVVGETTKRILDGFSWSILSATALQVSVGKAVLAENRDAVVRYGQLVGGGSPPEGVTTQNVSFSGAAVTTHGVYVRFIYGDGTTANRAFWDTVTDLEEIQAVATRKVAGWQVTIAQNEPGADWYKIADVVWDGSDLATSTITDKRVFLFEGPADSSPQTFRPTWGAGNDRNADRATYGVKTIERFASAVIKKIEEIQSDTPATRWWSTPVECLDKKVSRFGDAAMAGNYLPTPDNARTLGSDAFRWSEVHSLVVRGNDHFGRASASTTARHGMSANAHTLYTDTGSSQAIEALIPETTGNYWRVRFGGATNAVSITSVGSPGLYAMQARGWSPFSTDDANQVLGSYALTWGALWGNLVKSYYSDGATTNPALANAGLMVDNRSTVSGAFSAIGWAVGSGAASPSHSGDGWLAYAKRNANDDVDLIFARHNNGAFLADHAFFDTAGLFKLGPRTGTGWDGNPYAILTVDPGDSANTVIALGGWKTAANKQALHALSFTGSSGYGASYLSTGASSFGVNHWWTGVNDTDWTDNGTTVEGSRWFAQYAFAFGASMTHANAIARVVHARTGGTPFSDGPTGIMVRGGRDFIAPTTPQELLVHVGNHKIMARGYVDSSGNVNTSAAARYNVNDGTTDGTTYTVTFDEPVEDPYTVILTPRGLPSSSYAFIVRVHSTGNNSFSVRAHEVTGTHNALDPGALGGSGGWYFTVFGRPATAPG